MGEYRPDDTKTRGRPELWKQVAAEVPADHVPLPNVTAVAKAAGKTIFGKGGFLDAFGGDRCRKPPKQWYWQVVYVKNKRYLPFESLRHVDELSDTPSGA